MNILAFDTTMGACSVAVGMAAGDALETVESLYEDMATGQAERLMPMIDAAMRVADIGFADLDRIAVTVGPGTFTGTRIGIAAARALALATGAAVIGMSTLELMGLEALQQLGPRRGARPIAVVVDAHRGQVYAQRFAPERAESFAPQLLDIADAARLAADGVEIFAGTGAAMVVAAAAAAGQHAEAVLPKLQPNAVFLLLAAQARAPTSEPVRPLYLRAADAKPQVGKSLARAAP